MASKESKDLPVILHTPRLILRMMDPDSDADCNILISTFNDGNAGKGGNSRVGVTDPASLRKKHARFGPQTQPQLCTLAPPPKGMFFLVYIKPADTNSEPEEYVGMMAMSFRPEMPFPDIGYGIMGAYQGKGYASEAGRKVLEWWRDVIGVREICAITLPDNERSQRCAERIGLVREGTVDIVFGDPPDESQRIKGACGFILPGMEGRWPEGVTLHPTI